MTTFVTIILLFVNLLYIFVFSVFLNKVENTISFNLSLNMGGGGGEDPQNMHTEVLLLDSFQSRFLKRKKSLKLQFP